MSTQDIVMILYYLRKLLQFFFSPQLFHYFFIRFTLLQCFCTTSENQSDNFFFNYPWDYQHFRYFLCPFLQMLSPCYALASIAKPISCDRLRCLCRLHHKGTEPVPTIIPYNMLHPLAEEGQIYNSPLRFTVLWGQLLRRMFSVA